MPKTEFQSIEMTVTVRVWRRMHGFTQDECAAFCKMTLSKFRLIENGEVCPSIAELSRICEMIDEDVASFFKGKGRGQ